VSCFWSLEGEVVGPAGTDRVIPDGCPELIWNLADRFLRQDRGCDWRRQEAEMLVGQLTRPIRLVPGRVVSLVAVRFRPGALGSFLGGIPAVELTELDVRLGDAIGHRLAWIGERLHALPTPEARIACLERALASDLARAAPVDPAVTAAVDWIVAGHGTLRIEAVARRVGLSRRQLERRFLVAVGLTPKRLSRITRFQRLLTLLGRDDMSGWTGLAFRCGYYDQAHLARDFRDLAGCAPGEYLATGLPLGDLFLGAERTGRLERRSASSLGG
jgi:AraC-like DNA-binding protein